MDCEKGRILLENSEKMQRKTSNFDERSHNKCEFRKKLQKRKFR